MLKGFLSNKPITLEDLLKQKSFSSNNTSNCSLSFDRKEKGSHSMETKECSEADSISTVEIEGEEKTLKAIDVNPLMRKKAEIKMEKHESRKTKNQSFSHGAQLTETDRCQNSKPMTLRQLKMREDQ